MRYALERNARTRPDDNFAAFDGGERWTFAQTPQQVASLAGNLHELRVRQGDHVVLVLPTSPLALRVMFAINYLGAVYVPVNLALKGSSLERVLHNVGAAFAIAHDSVLDRVLAATPPARPRAGVEVRLVDENDCSVGVGEVGQLILRTEAPWAMNHGYNNNPQVTADAWRVGWFHAGPCAQHDGSCANANDGRLLPAARRSRIDLVRSNGN